MASTHKCPYCKGVVTSSDEICPSCGAPNEKFVPENDTKFYKVETPKTINELKEFCSERNMPLLRMRFFIDEDFKEPKAFGIYYDGSNYVVYKNKADGSRSVRYEGPDEAFAVTELYLKLVEECANRGIFIESKPGVKNAQIKKTSNVAVWTIIVVLFFIFLGITVSDSPEYYKYNDNVYCRYGNTYYAYDYDMNDYYETSYIDDELINNSEYYSFDSEDTDWSSNYDFTSSNYYYDNIYDYESSSSSSSDYSSWDSGSTDWGSDW